MSNSPTKAIGANEPGTARVVSLDDFAEHARRSGWTFWRGFTVGLLSLVAVAQPAFDLLS